MIVIEIVDLQVTVCISLFQFPLWISSLLCGGTHDSYVSYLHPFPPESVKSKYDLLKIYELCKIENQTAPQ